MKFLKSLVTDFGADSARFVFQQSSPERKEGEITNRETAEKYLHKETQERLDALGYNTKMLEAANEANKLVNEKLEGENGLWNKLKKLKSDAPEKEFRELADEYLVNKTLKDREARMMYRTEMFASLRAKLKTNSSELENLDEKGISRLLLTGSAAVYSYREGNQTVNASLKSASRMIKYNKENSGINIDNWTDGGKKSIMRYENALKNSKSKATLDDNNNLVIDGKYYVLAGAEILTGSGMAEYPKQYLKEFKFQNVIIEGEGDDMRVMARVENGCHGNLAVFRIYPQLESFEMEDEEDEFEDEDFEDEVEIEVGDEECEECENDIETIWNGLKNGDAGALEKFKEVTGKTEVNIDEALKSAEALYGDKEKEGVDKDGLYRVIEKYYNPKLEGGVFGMMRKIVADKSLSSYLVKAGYKADEAEKIMEAFTGASEKLDQVEIRSKEFAEMTKSRDAGAGKEFFKRLGASAVLSTAVAGIVGFPPGWALPALLGGASIIGLNTGVKRFNEIPGPDKIYAAFMSQEANASDIEGLWSTDNTSYLEKQRNALKSTEVAVFLGNDAIDTDAVLKQGPLDGDGLVELSERERQLYEAHDVSIEEVEETIKNIADKLDKSVEQFEYMAEEEGEQTTKAKRFKVRGKERKFFEESMERAANETNPMLKRANYENAMDVLLKEFNETAQKKLGVEWEVGLDELDKELVGEQKFDLGELPSSDGKVRRLYTEFIQNDPSVKNTKGQGEWKTYVLVDGKKTDNIAYMEASKIAGKRYGKLGNAEMKLLGYEDGEMSRKARRKIAKKLGFFDVMVGQVAQINETKDLMTLATWNEEQSDITSKMGKRLERRDDETVEEFKYRVAVSSKLEKYEDAESFLKLEKYVDFGPTVKHQIEDYYYGVEGALDALVKNVDFQKSMAELTEEMEIQSKREENLNNFITLENLEACATCQKKDLYLSGQAGMRESKYKTVTFGEMYMAYMVAEGFMSKEISEKITKEITEIQKTTVEHTIEGKNGMGPTTILVDVEKEVTRTVEEAILKKVQNWSNEAWWKPAYKKAIIALTGISFNTARDIKKNKPEKVVDKEHKRVK